MRHFHALGVLQCHSDLRPKVWLTRPPVRSGQARCNSSVTLSSISCSGAVIKARNSGTRLSRAAELIRWCEHLVVATPNRWWSAPALLKRYIDRVFVPGLAMRYHARFPYVGPLLKGRSERLLYTRNSPWLPGWLFRRDLFWRWILGSGSRTAGFVRRAATHFTARRTLPQCAGRYSWLLQTRLAGVGCLARHSRQDRVSPRKLCDQTHLRNFGRIGTSDHEAAVA